MTDTSSRFPPAHRVSLSFFVWVEEGERSLVPEKWRTVDISGESLTHLVLLACSRLRWRVSSSRSSSVRSLRFFPL